MTEVVMIQMSSEELAKLMRSIVQEEINKIAPKEEIDATTHSITQVCKRLKRGRPMVQRLINEGILKTTSDSNRVPEIEIQKYIKNRIENYEKAIEG